MSGAIDIAKHLEISPSSCSQSLKNLLKKGYVTENQDKFYGLTQEGEEQVQQIQHSKAVLMQFFTQKLQLDSLTAEKDACKIEHLVSQELIDKLEDYMGDSD